RRVVAVLAGVLLGLLVLVKALDMGFRMVLDRPFDALNDWAYLPPALGVLSDSTGQTGAILAVVAAVLGSATVLVLMPLSVLRLCRFAAGHRTASTRVVGVLGMAWVVLAAGSVQLSPASRVASMSTVELAYDQVSHLRADIRDRQVFADAIEVDRFDEVPGTQLLTELRGRDVLLVFVESYGRVAVEDP